MARIEARLTDVSLVWGNGLWTAEAGALKARAPVRVADADEDHVTLAVRAVRESPVCTNGLTVDAAAMPRHVSLVGPFDAHDIEVVRQACGLGDVPMERFESGAAGCAEAVLDAARSVAKQATDGQERATSAFVVAADDGRGVEAGNANALGVALMFRAERPDAPGVLMRMDEEPIGSAGAGGGLGGAGTGVEPLVRLVDLAGGLDGERREAWANAQLAGCFDATIRDRVPTLLDRMAGADLHVEDTNHAARLHATWARAGFAKAQGAFVSLETYQARAPARYRFEGQRCAVCQRVVFPPRECCPECAGPLEALQLSGRGSVYALTTIGKGGAPTEFEPLQAAVGAYRCAVVELDEGPRVAGMVTGVDDGALAIGAPVRAVLRLLYVQDGRARYGFKFRSDVPERGRT